MGLLDGSFDWARGNLSKKQVKSIQNEYLKPDATQDSVAEYFGTNKRAMGRCLARSNADWRPDLVHEHVKKIRYKNSLSEARENIASLMEDIESLRFANEHLRSVVGEAQRAGRSPGTLQFPSSQLYPEFQRRATFSTS